MKRGDIPNKEGNRRGKDTDEVEQRKMKQKGKEGRGMEIETRRKKKDQGGRT